MFDFDNVIDRRGTDCNKWDGGWGQPPVPSDEYSFTIADMDFPCPPCVSDVISKRAAHPIYGYTHPGEGLAEAVIGWMQRRHGAELKKEWIMNSTGILTGLSFALRAAAQAGDRVMVFTPVYNPFFTIIEGAGCIVDECQLINTGSRYEIDWEACEAHFASGIKAVMFCNPHNPVGRVWSREELERLAELCDRYNVWFLSDEAHADFALFGNKYTPISALKSFDRLGISCISSNKSFNTAGVSIAFVIIKDPEVKDKASRLQRGVWITQPTLFSMAAAEAGYAGADEWMDEVCSYIGANVSFVSGYIRQRMPKIKVTEPEGTFLMWLDISCFGMKDIDVINELKGYGVRLSPGKVYRGDGAKHIRFNIAAPRSLLEAALDKVASMYEKYCR